MELQSPPLALAEAWHRHRTRLAMAASLVLLVLAAVLLHNELVGIHLADIRQSLANVPLGGLLLSGLATAGSYLALTGYDVLALRHLGHPLPYRRAALISFVATSVGHNLGMAMLSAGAVRLRMYTAAGLSATEVAATAALVGLTFGVGAAFCVGLTLLADPAAGRLLPALGETGANWLGGLLLLLVGTYAALGLARRAPVRLGPWRLRLPGGGYALGQLLLAGADLTCAAAALYWLLPPDAPVGYAAFLGVYVLAVVAGIASHVPAGLGVFEMVLLLGLPNVPREGLLAAILAYRAIYYLLPLALAGVLATVLYLRARRTRLGEEAARLGAAFGWLAPGVVGGLVFVAGAVLLFSGSTPALSHRLALLRDFVPLPLLEASHLAGSLAGLGLVILARALFRRVDAAYHLAFWFLLAGALASLLKGLDYEEALLAGLALLLLRLGRASFDRPSSLLAQPLDRGGWLAVAAVLLAAFWLGMFAFAHVDYAHELWWQFAFDADAPRFLRASLLLALAVTGLGLRHLLRPAPPEPGLPDTATLARVTPLVAAAPHADAALALLGDKFLLPDPAGEAFLMYRVRGRSWVAMGDPVGPASHAEHLAWRFRELADRHGGLTVFYQVDAENLPLYLDMGLTAMKLGEEGVVPLAGFTLEEPSRKPLRQASRRARRQGLSFEMLPAVAVPGVMDALRRVSDAWLAEKNTREKGFALGRFQPDYLARFPCALVRHEGRLVAFANVWCAGGRHELSIDLMRHLPEAPKGVMDYLFIELMVWGAAEGYAQFNLGMAPLSGLETHPLAPLWHRLGTLVFRHGEHFYNFEGLRAYKDKFDPQWRPKYLAAPGGLTLPAVLLDVAALISGGVRGMLAR